MSLDSSQPHRWPSSVLTSIRPALVSRILNVHFCLSKNVNLSTLMLLLQCLFSIQSPLNFTPFNYLSSIFSTLASQIIAQNDPISQPFPYRCILSECHFSRHSVSSPISSCSQYTGSQLRKYFAKESSACLFYICESFVGYLLTSTNVLHGHS